MRYRVLGFIVIAAVGIFIPPTLAQPSDAPDGPDPGAGAQPIQPVRREVFVPVPLRGEIGREIVASGLRAVIEGARRKGVSRLVFMIDSSGGDPREAHAIAKLLRDAESSFTIHAVIEGDIGGAAVVLAAGADTIHARPSARLLGARLSRGRDAEEASALLADEIDVAAREQERDPLIWRAAVMRGMSVYAFRDADGSIGFTEEKPRKGDHEETERLTGSGDSGMFVVDAERLEKWEICKVTDVSLTRFGDEVDVAGWKAAGDWAKALVKDAAEERRRLLDNVDKTKRAVEKLVERAEEADPRKLKLKTTSGGLLTGNSQLSWREAADASIAIWENIRTAVAAVPAVERKLREQGLEHLVPVLAEDLSSECEKNLEWLRANRTKYYIDRSGNP